MNKFFGNKGLAAQGLKKIGEIAFAAKDELLYVGNEGKWGFCVEEAEAIEAGKVEEAKKIAGFADLLAPAVVQPNGKVTIHLIAGKDDSEKKIPEPRVKKDGGVPSPKTNHAGYKIEKDRPMRNGVTRPSATSLGGIVYAKFDRIGNVCCKDLAEIALRLGFNETMVRCRFYSWKKFNKGLE